MFDMKPQRDLKSNIFLFFTITSWFVKHCPFSDKYDFWIITIQNLVIHLQVIYEIYPPLNSQRVKIKQLVQVACIAMKKYSARSFYPLTSESTM